MSTPNFKLTIQETKHETKQETKQETKNERLREPTSDPLQEPFYPRKPIEELCPELSFKSEVVCSRRFVFYLTTASTDSKLEKSGTGDIDYRNILARHLKNRLKDTFCLIENLHDEQEIYSLIEKTKATKHPILHIIINAPNTGCLFNPQNLKQFKANGGRLVLTILEHEKYDLKLKEQTNQYITLADHCIFLDSYDKKSALESIHSVSGLTEDSLKTLNTTLEGASIIPVPATLELKCKPFAERGRDILVFCMFRYGAGYQPTIELAKLIKNSKDPELKNKQIWRVGSIFNHKEDDALLKLMLDVYPTQAEEIQNAANFTDVNNSTKDPLKILLDNYILLEKQGLLARALPIKLVVDCEVEELIPIFNQCRYAFSPKYNGADLRHSSTSTLLHHQFVLISHVGQKTPACLLKEGAYSKAMVLFVTDKVDNVRSKDYAQFAYDTIKEREQNFSINQETLLQTQKLLSQELMLPVIIEQIIKIYESVSKTNLSNLLKYVQLNRYQWVSFQRFKHATYVRRAFKEFYAKQNIDLYTLKNNFKNLLCTLREVKGDFSPEMLEVLSNKPKGETLVPLEKQLLLYLVREDQRYIMHSTRFLIEILKEKQLVSTDERERHILSPEERKLSYEAQLQLKQARLTINTPQNLGYTGFTYWTTGSKNPRTPAFLQCSGGQIMGDIDTLLDNNPYPMEGTLSCDHFAVYGSESHLTEKIKIFDTEFDILYQNRQKTLSYYLGKNEVRKQTVNFGEECFLFPQIEIARYLTLILRLRYLGKATWENAISTILNEQTNNGYFSSELLQTFFHPGIYELLIPGKIRIDQLGFSHKGTSGLDDSRPNPNLNLKTENNQWVILKIRANSHNIKKAFFILSHNNTLFPFLKIGKDDYFLNRHLNELNSITSFARKDFLHLKHLFTGCHKGPKNTFIFDNFYVCEVEFTEQEALLAKTNALADVIEIDSELHLPSTLLTALTPASVMIQNRKLCPLTLFLLYVGSNKVQNQTFLLQMWQAKFKTLYEKTYHAHSLIPTTTIYTHDDLLRYLEQVDTLLNTNPFFEVTSAEIDQIPAYLFFDAMDYCYKIFDINGISRYTHLAKFSTIDLNELLYKMHPFFIPSYQKASFAKRQTVSIIEALLWQYRGNPWVQVSPDVRCKRNIPCSETATQYWYTHGMSLATLSEFFVLALENETFLLEDYEELLYIAYLYLEQGHTVIADTIYKYIDFPKIKIALTKRMEEIITLGLAKQDELIPMKSSLSRLDLYWQNQGNQLKDSKAKTELSLHSILYNYRKLQLPGENHRKYRKRVDKIKKDQKEDISLNYEKTVRIRNLEYVTAFSIFVIQNKQGDHCFVFDLRNSNAYHPFTHEKTKTETKLNSFDELNHRLSLGYNIQNIQWNYLGRVYVSTPYKDLHHTFHVGFLDKLTTDQLQTLASSKEIAVVPFSGVEQFIKENSYPLSAKPKLYLKGTKFSITKLTESLLLNIKKHFLKSNSIRNAFVECKVLFESTYIDQEQFFEDSMIETKDSLTETKDSLIKTMLTSGYSSNLKILFDRGLININMSYNVEDKSILESLLANAKNQVDKIIQEEARAGCFSESVRRKRWDESVVPLIRRIQVILHYPVEIDLSYFRCNDYYRILLLANYNDVYDFSHLYQALDEKCLNECYKMACVHLSPHVKSIGRFVGKKTRSELVDTMLNYDERPHTYNNDIPKFLLAHLCIVYSIVNGNMLEDRMCQLYADLFQYFLFNKDLTDDQIDQLYCLAATRINHDSRFELAKAIYFGINKEELATILKKCIDHNSKSGDLETIQYAKDTQAAIITFADHAIFDTKLEDADLGDADLGDADLEFVIESEKDPQSNTNKLS